MLVIPYVNLMMNEELLPQYLQKYPVLQGVLGRMDNYRLEISIWFGGFYMVKNTLLIIFTYVQRTILKQLQVNIIDRMFRRYMRQTYLFHVETRSSDLVRSIIYDANHFVDGILVQGVLLISELLLFTGILMIMVWQSPIALGVLFIMVVPVVIVYLLIKRRLSAWGRVLQEREADVICHIQEGLGGIKDAIILRAQRYFENKFYSIVLLRAHVNRNRQVAIAAPRYIIETMMMVSMACALVWLDYAGGITGNLSTIAFLAVVAIRMLPMSNRVLGAISTLKTSGPSAEVIYENARPEVYKEDLQQSSNLGMGLQHEEFIKLEVVDLSFQYPGGDKVIDGVSFSVKNGEMIGFVGGSGAGKTTLVDLLLGLLVPTEGEIRVNKENIHKDLDSWQHIIGYVQQSVFLLDASIKENIAFGVAQDEIDSNRVMEVIRLAKLEEWINTLPQQLESLVGERGVRISGGQKQRIGIARALYHDPDILVLDEATSALDNRTEKEIMDDVYRMHGKRTIIMIAHRLDTIRRCDRILVLEDGKVVGEGLFDELMERNKFFQKISQVYDRGV